MPPSSFAGLPSVFALSFTPSVSIPCQSSISDSFRKRISCSRSPLAQQAFSTDYDVKGIDLRPLQERERGFGILWRELRRPTPSALFHKKLDLDFAVLLMRSGYEVCRKSFLCNPCCLHDYASTGTFLTHFFTS